VNSSISLLKTAKLTKEQKQLVATWLGSVWTDWTCPFHGETTWAIGDVIVGAPSYNPVGGERAEKVYPLVVLTCNKCGYTVFVNAISAGLEKRDPPPNAEPPEPAPEGA
jgi:hypothetical protein